MTHSTFCVDSTRVSTLLQQLTEDTRRKTGNAWPRIKLLWLDNINSPKTIETFLIIPKSDMNTFHINFHYHLNLITSETRVISTRQRFVQRVSQHWAIKEVLCGIARQVAVNMLHNATKVPKTRCNINEKGVRWNIQGITISSSFRHQTNQSYLAVKLFCLFFFASPLSKLYNKEK